MTLSATMRMLIAAMALWPAAAWPQAASPPTPKAVIYPGDVIREDMLVDSDPNATRDRAGVFVEDRAAIVGKVAKLTLLPGRLIPYEGVSSRKLIANGAEVRLVYAEDGLLIVTDGMALQDGSTGDLIRVRNSDSGVTVSGVVQSDGSIKVGAG